MTCQPSRTMLMATRIASTGSSHSQPVASASRRPTSTPADVTTSAMMCLPSATSAGDRALRPARMRIVAKTPLITAAARLSARPGPGAVMAAPPLVSVVTASRRISSAASTISTPSSTADKYSAL